MDVSMEKLWLIDKIIEIKDERLLKALKSMLEFGLQIDKGEPASDFWDELNDQQKEKIELSIRQLEAGEGISHDEVISSFRQKYSR